MIEQNPLDIIGQLFLVELMNPNPRMTPLKTGDRCTVSFEVDKETLDYFYDAGADGRAGMILEAVMKVTARQGAVGEVVQEPEPVKVKPKGGALCRLAGQWCNDENFIDWVSYHQLGYRSHETAGAEDVTRHVRNTCNIESRSELDHNKDAAKRFDTYFRKPYMAYMEGK